MEDYFKYRYSNEIIFNLKEGDFITILGNSNDFFVDTLLNGDEKCNIFVGDLEFNKENISNIRKRISYVLYKHLNIFLGETVLDEIAFGLESLAYSKNDMKELIDSKSKIFKIDNLLERDPNSLGISDKIKMKFLSALIVEPKILVIDNVMSELDYYDKLLIFDILDEYKKNGGIIINVTNDVEESLFSDYIKIIYNKVLVCDGKTMSVLNEEKVLKRLGIGLPFLVELNKYFMDYGMIKKYYLSNESLVNALWK